MIRSQIASSIVSTIAMCVCLLFVATLRADTGDSERPSRKGLDERQLQGVEEMEELRIAFESNRQVVSIARCYRMTDAAMYEIRDITSLTTLYASCRSDISDYGMQCLEKLTNLETLSVRGETITNEGVESLAKLTKLKKLYLIGGEMDNDCLATIVKLKNLETIYISQTNITEDTALFLREELPNCKVKIQAKR